MKFQNHNRKAAKRYSVRRLGRKYRLLPNFQVYEIASNDGADYFYLHPAQGVIMELIRDKFGATSVSSWCRSKVHNRKSGGASNSSHLYGMATDFRPAIVDNPSGVTLQDVYDWIDQSLNPAELGYYYRLDEDGNEVGVFIHVAIAKSGRRRRWRKQIA